ncbi:MAG: hypothetical protein Q8P84_04260 [Deltaproteobacteria bacterium]|nr:hypothetical protein [Deltaproteobacteria bacterium]
MKRQTANLLYKIDKFIRPADYISVEFLAEIWPFDQCLDNRFRNLKRILFTYIKIQSKPFVDSQKLLKGFDESVALVVGKEASRHLKKENIAIRDMLSQKPFIFFKQIFWHHIFLTIPLFASTPNRRLWNNDFS